MRRPRLRSGSIRGHDRLQQDRLEHRAGRNRVAERRSLAADGRRSPAGREQPVVTGGGPGSPLGVAVQEVGRENGCGSGRSPGHTGPGAGQAHCSQVVGRSRGEELGSPGPEAGMGCATGRTHRAAVAVRRKAGLVRGNSGCSHSPAAVLARHHSRDSVGRGRRRSNLRWTSLQESR